MMIAHIKRMLGWLAIIFLLLSSSAFAQSSGYSSSPSNFNGTSIAGGDYIWFSAVFKPTTTISSTATTDIYFQNQTISFTAGGVNYNLSVPNAQITFSPTALIATTVYNTSTNTWVTTIPANQNLSGNAFLSGFAFQVPAGGLPGGINPVTWSGTFTTDQPGVGLNWEWAAANYTSFSSNYGSLGIKPVDNNNLSIYLNSDQAGAPENYRSYVIGGARGGGGSNYTGSYSGTQSDSPPLPSTGQLTITTQDTYSPSNRTRSDKSYDVTATYTVPSASILYLTRTVQRRFANNVYGPANQDPLNATYTLPITLTAIQQTHDYGNFSPIDFSYSLETWTLSYQPSNLSFPPVVLATAQVYVYPVTTATISDGLTLGPKALNGKSYQGDAPRIIVEIDNAYPGGTTQVVFYQATTVDSASAAVLLTPISNTQQTAPTTDQTALQIFYFDSGNSYQGSGSYVIQVVQYNTAWGVGTNGAQSVQSATFTVNSNFQVNSAFGVTK
jgi:hypothetical protein